MGDEVDLADHDPFTGLDPFADLNDARESSIRRRFSTGSAHMAGTPDIELDYEADDAARKPRQPVPDMDTCRICRAEGTSDEPLFYPCRCSGSIKYVHQQCLMEWLSHSQKKHCELCKTSYRFTKLYSPTMPQRLPIRVFASHVAKYVFRNILVWMRALFVMCVWLGWLPYTMRMVWSSMFWISDFGFGGGNIFGYMPNPPHPENSVPDVDSTTEWASASNIGNGTCPVSHALAMSTSVSPVGGVMYDGDPAMLSFYGLDLTGSDPSFMTYVRLFLVSMGLMEWDGSPKTNTPHQHNSSVPEHISLLSEVKFLKNLTRNNVINNAVISILEGQIITVVVVVCFILIILVRDYVVQQQPENNMRAAFAAGNRHRQQQEQGQDPLLDLEERDGRPAHVLAVADGRGLPVDDHNDDDASIHQPGTPGAPDGPGRNEEENQPGIPATVVDYLRIYREANGDHDRILQIIRDEHLDDRLAYWVQRTRAMAERDRHEGQTDVGGGTAGPSNPVPQADGEAGDPNVSTVGTVGVTATPPSEAEFGSAANMRGAWDWPDDFGDTTSSDDKGKAKATPDSSEKDVGPSTPSGPSSEFDFNTAPPRPAEPPLLPREDRPRNGLGDFIRAFQEEEERDDRREADNNLDVDDDEDMEANEQMIQDDEQPNQLQQQEVVVGARRDYLGLLNRAADFMWGPLEGVANQEDLPDADPAGLADPAINNHRLGMEEEMDALMDEEAAALEQEAIEDAEDFDGIMELFGMRGPLFGLFQNALFCALLVTVTVFFAVFFPYNFGRIALWVTANPARPVQAIFVMAEFIQDVVLAGFGSVSLILTYCFRLMLSPFFKTVGTKFSAGVEWSVGVTLKSGTRILTGVADYVSVLASAGVGNFSAASREALYDINSHVGLVVSGAAAPFVLAFSANETARVEAAQLLTNGAISALDTARNLPGIMLNPSDWFVTINQPGTAAVEPVEPAYWNSFDRFLAILFGYLSITLIAGLYLSRYRNTVADTENGPGGWDAGLVDTLNQASGVVRVIFLIGIEMLAFPLYCGLLLDVALLPLFENTTIESRIQFTLDNPATSIFVHWFVGTGYMFHFALFVSMCRKIMRNGVLYFVRDPDDPEFHPVRDVLERSVMTQLRKIMFSAFVYGALIMVCLGGVVWGLWAALPRVLPIHYSSNEPVLEFPIDLLFYNFLMPLAVKFFKPSNGLKVMYTWWFRKCARMLRITWFLFGERWIDEEGTLHLAPNSKFRELPFWKRMFLEVDKKAHRVRPKPWANLLRVGKGRSWQDMHAGRLGTINQRKKLLVALGELAPDGRFVRTPSSDQVKLPKGVRVFLEVNEDNERKDGKPDTEGSDLYSSTGQYQMVYIPPYFKARIFLFILFIWIFAAITGVSFTIIPLVFGRRMFNMFLPNHVRTNDIYAFSIGMYVLGSLSYGLWHLRSLIDRTCTWARESFAGLDKGSVSQTLSFAWYCVELVYSYLVLLFGLPLLVSVLMELYLIIPLHTQMYGFGNPTPSAHPSLRILTQRSGFPGVVEYQEAPSSAGTHTIRIVQAWTLGLVYLKLLARFLTTYFEGTRLAASVRAVLRRGWLRPDAGILTRAFVLPALVLGLAGIVAPAVGADSLVRYIEANPTPVLLPGMTVEAAYRLGEQKKVLIYRLAYPCAAIMASNAVLMFRMVGTLGAWKMRIRDEAYLVGERLHNFSVARTSGRRTTERRHGGEGRIA